VVKFLLIAFFFVCILDARENPFFPSSGEKDIPYTSNEESTILPLKRATITLPSQARILQSVTIQYKNLDGSIENKTIQLENSVDWHLPIFISQSYAPSESIKKEEPLNIEPKKIKAAVACDAVDVNSTKSDEKYKQIASIQDATFYSSGKQLKIVTKDKILRNFFLVQPHRIVIDFKKESSVKRYEQKIEESNFTKIRVGNHEGYYRVVIELDGFYKYKMDTLSDSYIFELK